MVTKRLIAAILLLCLLVQVLCVVTAGAPPGCETVLLQGPSDSDRIAVAVSISGGSHVYATWGIAIANKTSGVMVIRETLSTVVGPSKMSHQLAQLVRPTMSPTIAASSYVSSSYVLPGYIQSGDILRLTLVWDDEYGRGTAEWQWEYRCQPTASGSSVQETSEPRVSHFWQWLIIGGIVVGLIALFSAL